MVLQTKNWSEPAKNRFSVALQVTQEFELYAIFGPLVNKAVAINTVNTLLNWIQKEETRLLILNPVTV